MGMLARPTPPRPGLDAERLRHLVILGLAEHEDVTAVRPVRSIYRDRLGLVVVDRAGREFRMHIIVEPRTAA